MARRSPAVLHRGAEQLAANAAHAAAQLVDAIFLRALGRAHRGRARGRKELLALAPSARTRPWRVEDLLWSIVMLPEFQVIY